MGMLMHRHSLVTEELVEIPAPKAIEEVKVEKVEEPKVKKTTKKSK